jgi:hypothetical protein
LFTAAELPALREQAQTGVKGRVLARLREFCADRMDPASPHYFDFREREKEIWRTRQGIFTVVPTLNALATGYALAGDSAIGDFARDALMAIIDHGLADVQSLAWGSRTEGWRRGPGHDKGKFALSIAWIYDFCYDRFSAAQRERFAEYARETIRLADEWRQLDTDQIANNRGVRGRLAPTWLCLALEGDAEIEGMQRYIEEGERAIEQHLFLSYDAAGAPYEGAQYSMCLAFVMAAAEALRRRGGMNLLANNRFERFPEYLLYEMLPGGGAINNLNDAHLTSGSVTGAIALMGTERGALLPWLATQVDLHPLRVDDWLGDEAPGGGAPPGENLLYFLRWWRDDIPVREPRELGYPLSRLFSGRGLASLRTGWGAEDWLVSHFCGRPQPKCHRQFDLNHVSFYALGERFLVDAGYGHIFQVKDKTASLDRWFKETQAHNGVLVDGANQTGHRRTPGWSEGEMLDYQHTDAFDTTLGDAASSTGPDHRVRRSLRRVAMVRRGPAPYLAVVDVNEKDGAPFLTECLWHTDFTNRIECDGSRFTIHGQSADCHGEVLWPADARLTLGDSHGRPQLRAAVEAPVSEVVTVFCPRRRGEALPRFSCDREAEGSFRITCEAGGETFHLSVSAATRGPLREPLPVRVEVSTR